MYATWKINQNQDGTYSGPHQTLNEAGINLETIYSTSMPETYLSRVTGDISNLDLSNWSFEILSVEEARQFVESTALPEIERELTDPGMHSMPTKTEDIVSKII